MYACCQSGTATSKWQLRRPSNPTNLLRGRLTARMTTGCRVASTQVQAERSSFAWAGVVRINFRGSRDFTAFLTNLSHRAR